MSSDYGTKIPLGMGATIELVIDTSSARARARVVDDHYGNAIPSKELLDLAGGILATFFLQQDPWAPDGEGRDFIPARGWSREGWARAMGRRVAETWTPISEGVVAHAA